MLKSSFCFFDLALKKKKNETKQDSTNTVKEGDTKSHCGSAPIVIMRKKATEGAQHVHRLQCDGVWGQKDGGRAEAVTC